MSACLPDPIHRANAVDTDQLAPYSHQLSKGFKMRVLHVISEMGAGGAESLVAEMVRRGSEVGWTSGLASSGGLRQDELLTQADVAVFPVPLAGRRPVGVASAALGLRRAIRSFDPALIVGHNVGSTFSAALAAGPLLRRVPLITVFHGVGDADYSTAARILSRAPHHVVAVSGAIAERLRAAGLTQTPVTVIPNAVSSPTLSSAELARRELGVDPGAPVALCLARMVEQKRHDILLEAWSTLDRPATLLLAGDGPLRPALEAQAETLGLGESVRFLGVRTDVGRLLSAADVTTLSSDWEGLPIAVLESMAAGRPVIATNVDGVSEAVGSDAGLIVPRRDPAALGVALAMGLFDADTRRVMSMAAIDRISERHDPSRMMRTYADVARLARTRVKAAAVSRR